MHGERSVISSVLQAVFCLYISICCLPFSFGLQVELVFKSTTTFLKNCYKLFHVCAFDYSHVQLTIPVYVCVYVFFSDTHVWICPLKKLLNSESLERLKLCLCFRRISWLLSSKTKTPASRNVLTNLAWLPADCLVLPKPNKQHVLEVSRGKAGRFANEIKDKLALWLCFWPLAFTYSESTQYVILPSCRNTARVEQLHFSLYTD